MALTIENIMDGSALFSFYGTDEAGERTTEIFGATVLAVAKNCAAYYAERGHGGDVEACLRDEVLPRFIADEYQVYDWATGNMNFEDFDPADTFMLEDKPDTVISDLWANPQSQIVDRDDYQNVRALG